MFPVSPLSPFTYATNGTGITITGYTGPGGAVAIPAVINGRPVTDIGLAAFAGVNTVTDVTIPNSVTSIEVQAFFSCAPI